MIVSRTPYRVSFGGGGSDLPAFYRQESGAVVACAIHRFLHVAATPWPEGGVQLHHEEVETVASAQDLVHPIVGESLRSTGVERGIRLYTTGQVLPGTGLGSSSALAVGMAALLAAWNRECVDAAELARRACVTEIDRLGGSLGKQDQTITAHGGLCLIEFQPDETVSVSPIRISAADRSAFEERVLLFYTGRQRVADSILTELAKLAPDRIDAIRNLRDHALLIRDALERTDGPDFEEVGRHLHAAWMEKRALWPGSSTPEVDAWYESARDAGALGGRLLGAGGGGYVLILAERDRHAAIREALGHPMELPFRIEARGVTIQDLRG